MAFSIRTRLVHRETGLRFKDWAIKTGVSRAGGPWWASDRKYALHPMIDENGQPWYVDHEDFYTSCHKLESKDWHLEVAVKKDEKGRWIYRRVERPSYDRDALPAPPDEDADTTTA